MTLYFGCTGVFAQCLLTPVSLLGGRIHSFSMCKGALLWSISFWLYINFENTKTGCTVYQIAKNFIQNLVSPYDCWICKMDWPVIEFEPVYCHFQGYEDKTIKLSSLNSLARPQSTHRQAYSTTLLDLFCPWSFSIIGASAGLIKRML